MRATIVENGLVPSLKRKPNWRTAARGEIFVQRERPCMDGLLKEAMIQYSRARYKGKLADGAFTRASAVALRCIISQIEISDILIFMNPSFCPPNIC